MKWIITGVAGFIGSNAAAALVARGDEVVGLDDLSRPGTERNLAVLEALAGPGRFRFVRGDIRQPAAVDGVLADNADAEAVLHLAAQVAVTTSVRDPRADFEINALGSFNICEGVRLRVPDALLLYASTNKVYGADREGIVLADGRWSDPATPRGIPETRPLDFHSPYACSKGAADQYVLDYGRSYGLKTVSLRQSCIYGPRQFGIEDQGWVAWLSLAALTGTPFTIFGDGRQVRDILYVSDLVDLYVACAEAPDRAAGKAFNVGGGPANVLSLLELVSFLEERLGRPLEYVFDEPRVGDQRYYVSDTAQARAVLDWEPSVALEAGLERLLDWLQANLDEIVDVLGGGKLAHLAGARAERR
jgi:CDP-paratose 2-epimerase